MQPFVKLLWTLVCFVAVNTIDCKSQCNVSVAPHTAPPMTTQLPAATVRSLSLLSNTGFIRVDRSPTGQCPRTGQQSCAVALRASPGQRINVSLWDFTMRGDDQQQRAVTAHQAHGVETCYRCASSLACAV